MKFSELYLDRSKVNPKQIAETLRSIGCPFTCEYTDFTVTEIHKRSDTNLGSGVLQLNFELNVESIRRNTVKGLDYTLDMLISDFGAIFGILLGLSLIDIIIYCISALKSCVNDIDKTRGRRVYDMSKWLIITGSVGCLIVLSLSADFSNLLVAFSVSKTSSSAEDFGFLTRTLREDIDAGLIQWGPEAVGRQILKL